MTDPQRTITQVMEKLLAYVQHKRTCPKSMMVTFAAEPGWVTGSYVKPCTCGLDDLAAVLSGSREQKEDTRVDEGQPRACPPTGSTAASNEPTQTKDCGCVLKLVTSQWWAHASMCQTCDSHRNER
jgi:hypothetical protein